MIPAQNIIAWGNVVPWADPRQVEQDLIISRALVGRTVSPGVRNSRRQPARRTLGEDAGDEAEVRYLVVTRANDPAAPQRRSEKGWIRQKWAR